MPHLDSIPSTIYGPPNCLPRVIPKVRARNKPWALLGVAPNQNQTDQMLAFEACVQRAATLQSPMLQCTHTPAQWCSFSVSGDPTDTDYTAVGCAITTISSNLTEMSKGVKLLAALMDDEVGSGEDLLRAARTLAGAVSDLLKAVQPTSGEVSPQGCSLRFQR